MKKIYYKIILLTIFTLTITPVVASAHQPRIVTVTPVTITSPEISKAYYSTLKGKEEVYNIVSDKPFALYVNVLVPDIAGQKKDVSAVVIKDGNTKEPIVKLDGIGFEWKKFFEPFGYDTYWQGPEYKAEAPAGSYEIIVSSINNDSKYSLAVGELEAFDYKEGMNALKVIPILKKDFFNESPANFIFSMFGWGLILIMFTLAFIFGFFYRFILKRIAKNTVRGVGKNISKSDRILRFVVGIILFVWGITTSWSMTLLFLSGFCFFEAIFSWCGFYAAIGKSTCPL